jgi:hypothetical protein
MCRQAGIWRSGNKRALSAGLLNWRDRCRARGQAFLAECDRWPKTGVQDHLAGFVAVKHTGCFAFAGGL